MSILFSFFDSTLICSCEDHLTLNTRKCTDRYVASVQVQEIDPRRGNLLGSRYLILYVQNKPKTRLKTTKIKHKRMVGSNEVRNLVNKSKTKYSKLKGRHEFGFGT